VNAPPPSEAPASRAIDINWQRLVGGDSEVTWLEDRRAKLDRIAELGKTLGVTATVLEDVRWSHLDWTGCFESVSLPLGQPSLLQWSHPQILAEVPAAADWYVSLAGYALKTLGNVAQHAREQGLSVSPKTLVQNLARSRTVADAQRLEFSRWVNSEIHDALSGATISREQALVRVALILGGRIIGQGQNERGNEAVAFLKALILKCPRVRLALEAVCVSGAWLSVGPEEEIPPLSQVAMMRLSSGATLDFRGGGDRPDIRLTNGAARTLLLGEVKGRKDISNAWESWMPQIADHVRTWAAQEPNALRAVFGTLFNAEMVGGESTRGTARVGLRRLHEEGLLNVAYNLSNLEVDDSYFAEFQSQFESLILG
jgi:hypothetical protein